MVRPTPNATGLAPMNDATIERYYSMARQVQDGIGVGVVSQFAWTMFDFAYPGAGTP